MRICSQCQRSFGEEDFRACPFDGAVLMEERAIPADPLLGRILDGRFRIVGIIGHGGMGAVYKAVHLQMDRICAIKLLSPVATDKESSIARFRREAKMTSRIDSPNAVTIYDFGEAEPGLLYIAMEYIEGESLADLLTRERSLSIERVVSITNQISRALAAAHALGIVHRDLKPANIMLTRKSGENEVVKVLDFGIAKTLTDAEEDGLTQTGFLVGTPTYMSPEQVFGERVDSRSDVYSLAIIAYQMLSGELPFEGDTLRTVMMNRVNTEPTPLRVKAPAIAEAIERVVMAGLSRDPENRTADVHKFAAALNAAVGRSSSKGEVPVSADIQHASSTGFEQTQLTPVRIANPNLPEDSYETLLSPSRKDPGIQEVAPILAPRPAAGEKATSPAQRQPPLPAATSQPSDTRNTKPLVLVIIASVMVVIVIGMVGVGGYLIYSRSLEANPASDSSQQNSQPSEPNVERDGLQADARYATGRTLQQEASSLTEAGSGSAARAKNEQAVSEYRKAIESRPNFPQAHENMGVALYDLGKAAEAVAEYEIAIKQYDEPTSQVLTNYGMALLATSRFQDAAEAFSQALTLRPADADLHYYRGFALHYAGDGSGSKEAFARYLLAAPTGTHAGDVKDILAGRAAPSLKQPGK